MTALHCRRATVITFNYDLLIEHTMQGMAAWDFEAEYSSGALVGWTDALGGLPGFPPTPSRWSGEQHPTLSLLKLHGSLNWYWVPDDHVGTTLSYWDLDPDRGAIRRYLPGRVPFVVPPASLKSGFFRSPIMGEIWQSAARALRTAERVARCGVQADITVDGSTVRWSHFKIGTRDPDDREYVFDRAAYTAAIDGIPHLSPIQVTKRV